MPRDFIDHLRIVDPELAEATAARLLRSAPPASVPLVQIEKGASMSTLQAVRIALARGELPSAEEIEEAVVEGALGADRVSKGANDSDVLAPQDDAQKIAQFLSSSPVGKSLYFAHYQARRAATVGDIAEG